MFRSILFFVALSLTTLPALAQSPTGCKPIQFSRGTSSTTLTGSVGSDEPFPCYTIATGAGQTATLKFTRTNSNMAFTITDMVDDRESYTFKTEAKIYKFTVFQTLRAAPAPFALMVSVH